MENNDLALLLSVSETKCYKIHSILLYLEEHIFTKIYTYLLYLFITNGEETILCRLAAKRLRVKLVPPLWKPIHFKFSVHLCYPPSLKF